MPYIVNFTDKDNKTPITVFDNTSSNDTSLTFPGRNVTGYGQIIAENFLKLLENFASAAQPVNPIEGQLWYDSANGVLQLWDNTNWKAASNIQKGPVEPSVESSKVGELWVDTTNQQLRIYTGARWILVGPSESFLNSQRYGPAVEQITDIDGIQRVIVIFYVADIPVVIVSKDSFVPKLGIEGFPNIKSGMNVNVPNTSTVDDFIGGFLPKLYGTATSADALNIGTTTVSATKFLRSDTTNTLDFDLRVKNNKGITLGLDGNFVISNTITSARLYNSAPGSSLDLQTNRDGVPNTVLRILDNKVGINKLTPTESLDIVGNIGLSGSLVISNITESTNLSNGTIVTSGGVSIGKNLIIGTNLLVNGLSRVGSIHPTVDYATIGSAGFDCGTETFRWKTVRAQRVIAETIEGVLQGNISGNANTATSLKSITSFRLTGDVTSTRVDFDGRPNEGIKLFDTRIEANIIADRQEPFPNQSRNNDYVLVFRETSVPGASSGLLKQSRNVFVGDLGMPIGAILPFAGNRIPLGYLLCDGSEIDQTIYADLYDVIGTTYNGNTPLQGINSFRLPDLRGRFALGKDNMNNEFSITIDGGLEAPAGGGNIDRVKAADADTLGGAGGQESTVLRLGNLPDHTHSLRNTNGNQYSAVRVTPSLDPPAAPGLGPTATGQAQYLNNSGFISKPTPQFVFGDPVGLMNPYLTINYIIRSGLPRQ